MIAELLLAGLVGLAGHVADPPDTSPTHPGMQPASSYSQPVEVDGPVQAEVLDILDDLGRADEFDCIDGIYQRESTWQPDAIGDRDRGGSHGLPQRHAPVWGAPPSPWPIADQVAWTIEYAEGRYGDLCDAYDAHLRQGWW